MYTRTYRSPTYYSGSNRGQDYDLDRYHLYITMNAGQQASLAILTPHFNGETRETLFSCKLCLENPNNSRLIYGDWVDMQEHVHRVHKQNIDPEG